MNDTHALELHLEVEEIESKRKVGSQQATTAWWCTCRPATSYTTTRIMQFVDRTGSQ
jgi:hypothetical protein